MAVISHSSVCSPVFRLLDVYQFDVFFTGDGYTLRIELFQDVEDPKKFRCSFWQLEVLDCCYNEIEKGEAKTNRATYLVQVDWSPYLDNKFSLFAASSPGEALSMVIDDLRKYLAHASGSDE